MLTTIRRTLIFAIPIAIFVILLAWLQALPTDPARYRNEPVHLPCADIEGTDRCSTDAYIDIQAAIADMISTCEAKGWGVQAWAEANPQAPRGYEVLASCAGTRSEPVR